MECLNNIVGLVTEDNECLDIEFVESDSGLYLDDTTAGRIPLKHSFYANTDIYNNIIPDAVKEAIRMLRVKSERHLARNFRNHQTGIGFHDDYTGYISEAPYYYMAIYPRKIKGGIIRINTVTIYTQSGKHAGNFTVVQDGVATTATTATWEPKNYNTDEIIYLYYAGARPRNFAHTGCCGRSPGYKGWADIGGGTVSSLANLEWKDSSLAHGFKLDVTFDCDGFNEEVLCNLDFQTDWGQSFAWLVQCLGRKNIGFNILTNDSITQYLIASREDVADTIEYLNKQIEVTTTYLLSTYNHSDCFRCRGISKGSKVI